MTGCKESVVRWTKSLNYADVDPRSWCQGHYDTFVSKMAHKNMPIHETLTEDRIRVYEALRSWEA